jgi:transcriptional regulator with XRE-family HTH domain
VSEKSLIAERIKEERVRLGLLQEQAGANTGVSREMWGRYERGKAVPGSDVLSMFAAIGADADYIVTGKRLDPINRYLLELEKNWELSESNAAEVSGRLNELRVGATAAQQARIDFLLDSLGDAPAKKRRMESAKQVGERLMQSKEIALAVIADSNWKPPQLVEEILHTAIFEGMSHRGAVSVLEMLKKLMEIENGGKTGGKKKEK